MRESESVVVYRMKDRNRLAPSRPGAGFAVGTGRRPAWNIQMTARENCGYFFPKSDCLLGSQFCLSGSLLRDERVVYQTAS